LLEMGSAMAFGIWLCTGADFLLSILIAKLAWEVV
jgi:hypothetical protein